MKKVFIIFLIVGAILLRLSDVQYEIEATAFENEQSEFTNTIVFVNFNGDDENVDLSAFQGIYDGNGATVTNYFDEISNGKINIKNVFCGEVFLENSAEYYMKESCSIQGYSEKYYSADGSISDKDSGRRSADEFIREQLLVRQTVEKLNKKTNELVAKDGNGDGKADSLTIIVNFSETDNTDDDTSKSDILRAHKSEVVDLSKYLFAEYYFDEVMKEEYEIESATIPMLSGVPIGAYNIINSDADCGKICHELLHVFGLSDLYSYEEAAAEYVSDFDIMGRKVHSNPQYPLTYIRLKNGWLNETEISDVTKSGVYTLAAATEKEGTKALRLVLDGYFDKLEYFLIEVRSKKSNSKFDKDLNGDGIIISRINEENAYIAKNGFSANDYGNMFGNPEISLLNKIGLFYLNGAGVFTDSVLKYSDGAESGCRITEVRENADGTFTFRLTLESEYGESGSGYEIEPTATKLADGNLFEIMWKTKNPQSTVIVLTLLATPKLTAEIMLNKTNLTLEKITQGNFDRNKVLSLTETWGAARHVAVRESGNYYVFVFLNSDDKNVKPICFSHIENASECAPEYSDVLRAVVKINNVPLFVFILIVVLGLVMLVIYMVRKRKKPSKTRTNR